METQTEQLLDLMLHLKQATPAAAKQILNSQPQIAYKLISLMVSMNAIDIDVFQKTLAAHSAKAAAPPMQAPAPLSAIPPHMQQSSSSRTSTPPYPPQNYGGYPSVPSHTPTPPNAGGYATPPNAGGGYATPPNYGYGGHAPPAAPTPPPAPRAAPVIPGAMLAGMSNEQKQMLMGVVAMTPEQINALSAAERANVLQLRAAFGIH
ncbi:hypothetical protein MKEN_00033800 [Mycena kentingensis (nom. inval.)]|nr:hypothetical protein MKEN_00033800 [Mycena kentingensis (nom. inval.)]